METRQCIRDRRSIRRFTDQSLSDEIIYELLEAVRWSPSWANTQCWEVVVIRDQENKQKLAEWLSGRNPAAKAITEAPAIFILCARKERAGFKGGIPTGVHGDWYMFDVGIATQSLCLAACDLGLGTVCVGLFDNIAVDKLIGLPEGVVSVNIVPVGYPAAQPISPPRKQISEFVHGEHFGQALNSLE